MAEEVLNESTFSPSGLLETIVDQVSARGSDIDGAYVVVVQSGPVQHPFATDTTVIRAYLELVSRLRAAGIEEVIVNFADVAGIVAGAVGATGFATGPTTTLRQVHRDGFIDEIYGISLPYYYSHRVVGEYRTESDLDRIVDAGLFRLVEDRTRFSADLVDAIHAGGKVSSVAAWAEGQGNTKSAGRHFLRRMIIEGQRLADADGSAERERLVVDWLDRAEATGLLLDKRLDRDDQIGRRAPVGEWTEIMEGVRG